MVSWNHIILFLGPLSPLAAATVFSRAATDVVPTQPSSPPVPDSCIGTCSVHPFTCGLRATCEVFNPIPDAPKSGQQFCVCQAGYRALGVEPTDTNLQYRMTWQNIYGDQSHRVFVLQGQSCDQLCDDVFCSEVAVKDTCR